jgi:hypothetical protein
MARIALQYVSPRKWNVVRNGKIVYTGAFKYACAIVNRYIGRA